MTQRYPNLLFATALLLISCAATAEALSYSIYSLPLFGGDPKLIAEGQRTYSPKDIEIAKGPASDVVNWQKTLSISQGFEIGANVYREPRRDGFRS